MKRVWFRGSERRKSSRHELADRASEEVGRPSVAFGRALSWSYVLTIGRTVVSLVVSLVLARLLGPEAFGTVAMAMVFVLFVDMLVRQGLLPAIVQRPELTTAHLDTAFWMTTIAAFGLVPVVAAGSGWWAAVNETPELGPVIVALSVLLPLKGLGLVQLAQIKRSMDFRLLAVRTSIAVVVGGILGIVAAVAGFGIWALVIQNVVTAALELILIWMMSSWRPRRRFSRQCARDLFGFSGRSALATFGVFLGRRSDALLIGLFFGPVVVGLYRMAARLIDNALEFAAGALQSTFLPELSRYQQDRDRFNDRTVEVLSLGAILAIPLVGGLAAISGPLLALLGDEWVPATTALQILCTYAVVQSLSMFSGPILQAAGRPGLFARSVWMTAVLSAGSFLLAAAFGAHLDVEGQVWTIAVTRSVIMVGAFFVVVLPVLKIGTGLSIRRILVAVWPATAAAASGFAMVYASRDLGLLPWPAGPVANLFASGSLAVVVMVGILAVTDSRSREVIPMFRKLIGKRFRHR